IDFDVTGLLGQFARMDDVARLRMQCAKQRGGETAGRTESGTSRNIRERRDLDLAGLARKQPQRLAHDAVLDLVDRIDVLDRRIFQIDARLERLYHTDIDVFVDRGRDQKSLMLTIIGGEVGAAAAEADTQGRS